MHWQLWHHAGPRDLPENVRHALAKQFQLDTLITNNWCFLEQSGRYAGRPVRFFRIIDPCLIGKGVKIPVKYSELDEISYKNALQFEGYIEREGYVILRDRRPKPPVASLANSGAAQ